MGLCDFLHPRYGLGLKIMTDGAHNWRSKLEGILGGSWHHGLIMTLVIALFMVLNSYPDTSDYVKMVLLPIPISLALWIIGTISIISGLLIQDKYFETGTTLIAVGCLLWLLSPPRPVYFESFILVCYQARTISKKADRLRRFWAILLSLGAVVGFYMVLVVPEYRYSRAEDTISDFETWLSQPATLIVLTLGPILVCISVGFFWQLGLSSRRQLMKLRDLEDKAELAAVRERNRIAREMHDIIAHSLTVMIAQADGGKFAGKKDPELALQALGTIGEVGRKALGETRQLLSVLHESAQDERELGLTPGVDGIEDLVREARRAGAEVTYRVEGKPQPVAESVGLSIFRIVQESFTNALKHAGPRPITAAVLWDETVPEVNIRIENELGLGLISESETEKVNGHGLVGIAERVRMHGGTVTWGKLDKAGKWYVDTHLPL